MGRNQAPYRWRRNYENCQIRMYPGVGQMDFPMVRVCHALPEVERWIGFNEALTCRRPEKVGVHFWIDDYKFERIWRYPARYMEMLSKFAAVLEPDFSTYRDFPRAVQIYNVYRNKWLAALWQEYGLNVIPAPLWSDVDSYKWCFDSYGEGGVVATSSIGCMDDAVSEALFVGGYNEMVRRLKPDNVLFWGKVPEGLDRRARIMRLETAAKARLKKVDAEKVDAKKAGVV